MSTRHVDTFLMVSDIGFLSYPFYICCLWLQAILSSLLIKNGACDDALTLCPTCLIFVAVVQRVDTVSEGIANYGGKINAVEKDLKKLGKFDVLRFIFKKIPQRESVMVCHFTNLFLRRSNWGKVGQYHHRDPGF